jgi:hypothetical protein
VVQGQRDVRCDDGRLARVDRGDQADRAVDVVLGIERQCRVVLGPAVGIGVLGFFRQQPGAIAEHDLGQLGRVPCGEHRAGETLAGQRGQVSAVIEMGMGEDHRIDLPGRQRQWLPVTPPQLPSALEQAALQQDPRITSLDQELAAGDHARATQEGQRRTRTLAPHSRVHRIHARSLGSEQHLGLGQNFPDQRAKDPAGLGKAGLRGAGTGAAADHPVRRRDAQGVAADRHRADPVAGHHHPRQRQRGRVRGGLLPGGGRGQVRAGDRERPRRDRPDRADPAAQGPRPAHAGSEAGRDRRDQPGTSARFSTPPRSAGAWR